MVILQLAMSLDGYIAREDGSVDFLGDMGESTQGMFDQFLRRINTIVMGRTTYDQMLSFGDIPFTDKRIIVLTSRPLDKTYPHVEAQQATPEELVRSIPGNLWLFGGAKVIHDFMDANLVDRFELFVVPHILGAGIPLFDKGIELSTLQLMESKSYGNNILLVYENTSNR